MSRSKNAVSLIGIAGKDAIISKTQGGVSYARFSVATSEGGYRKKDGTQVPESTQWHNVIVWRELAEHVAKHIKKGMLVAVDGKIIYGEYDKNGVRCLSVDIVADDVVLMQRMQQAAQPQQAQQAQQYQQPKQMQGDIFTYDEPPF